MLVGLDLKVLPIEYKHPPVKKATQTYRWTKAVESTQTDRCIVWMKQYISLPRRGFEYGVEKR